MITTARLEELEKSCDEAFYKTRNRTFELFEFFAGQHYGHPRRDAVLAIVSNVW